MFTVFVDDKLAWFGELERPESGGVETITLIDIEGISEIDPEDPDPYSTIMLTDNDSTIGTVHFYFGTEDQEPNAYR